MKMLSDKIQFKPGDVVKLKSGGPIMTIQSVNENSAYCVWFDGTKIKERDFVLDVLVLHSNIPPIG